MTLGYILPLGYGINFRPVRHYVSTSGWWWWRWPELLLHCRLFQELWGSEAVIEFVCLPFVHPHPAANTARKAEEVETEGRKVIQTGGSSPRLPPPPPSATAGDPSGKECCGGVELFIHSKYIETDNIIGSVCQLLPFVRVMTTLLCSS